MLSNYFDVAFSEKVAIVSMMIRKSSNHLAVCLIIYYYIKLEIYIIFFFVWLFRFQMNQNWTLLQHWYELRNFFSCSHIQTRWTATDSSTQHTSMNGCQRPVTFRTSNQSMTSSSQSNQSMYMELHIQALYPLFVVYLLRVIRLRGKVEPTFIFYSSTIENNFLIELKWLVIST